MTKRLLGLDVGDRRIGLALSDPLGLTAQPLSVVERKSWKRDIAAIMEAVGDNEIEAFIVGLPISMSGNDSEQADRVRHFCSHLERETELAVHLQDERLSTAESERLLIAGGTRRDRRRQSVDMTAATLILQSWMDKS
jgi:putative Holliday junction resolvase